MKLTRKPSGLVLEMTPDEAVQLQMRLAMLMGEVTNYLPSTGVGNTVTATHSEPIRSNLRSHERTSLAVNIVAVRIATPTPR